MFVHPSQVQRLCVESQVSNQDQRHNQHRKSCGIAQQLSVSCLSQLVNHKHDAQSGPRHWNPVTSQQNFQATIKTQIAGIMLPFILYVSRVSFASFTPSMILPGKIRCKRTTYAIHPRKTRSPAWLYVLSIMSVLKWISGTLKGISSRHSPPLQKNTSK